MSKVVKILALVLFAVLAFSQPGMAREFADIYTDCGLGAMIAPRNDAVAAVTNVTWDCGTTAISSQATTPDSCQGGKEKLAWFINDSYESLENDLASGQGTYLDTLLVLAGRDSLGKDEYIAALRIDFAKIVADPTYTNQSRFEKAEALYNLVYKQSASLS